MIRISASAVPRLVACPASAVLPHVDYETTFAEDGSDRHGDAEASADIGDHDGLPDVVTSMILDGDKLNAEMALAYDVATDTARELGHVDRKYAGLTPFEIPGTPDLVIIGNGRAIVVDYKSFEEVEHAESNTQTATYALMVARTYGFDEVTVVISYLAGTRRPTTAVLSSLDLDAHAARLKQLQLDVAGATANPAEHVATGKHCKYCPAFLACPKQAELRESLSTDLTTFKIEAAIPFDSDEAAADAFDLLGRIKMLTTRLSAALYARAAERSIPLHDGRVLGIVEKQGNEKLDGDVVYAIVKAQHGQGIADAAVERKATKKRLREALSFAGSKGQVAELERGVLKAVRAAGGSKQETRVVVEVHEPKRIANG